MAVILYVESKSKVKAGTLNLLGLELLDDKGISIKFPDELTFCTDQTKETAGYTIVTEPSRHTVKNDVAVLERILDRSRDS